MSKEFQCTHCNRAEFDTAKQLSGHQMTCRPKDNIESRTRQTEERVPFGSPEQRFDVPDDDGFRYHVFNDRWKKEPGRIQRALNSGYEFVETDKSGGNVGTNEDGTEIKGVLMRIPKELWKEDRAVREREMDRIENQIHKGTHALEGDDKRYNPEGGTKITTSS